MVDYNQQIYASSGGVVRGWFGVGGLHLSGRACVSGRWGSGADKR